MPRAQAMSPEERRKAILDATIPLLKEHGRQVTTKQIADAAGIAEGTIFRVFDSKDEVLEEAFLRALDPQEFLDFLISWTPPEDPKDLLLELTKVFQARLIQIFALMTSLGVNPRTIKERHQASHDDWRIKAIGRIEDLMRPHADGFRLPTDEVVNVWRLLTWAGSHPHISQQQLSAEQIVDVIWHGTRTLEDRSSC